MYSNVEYTVMTGAEEATAELIHLYHVVQVVNWPRTILENGPIVAF